MEAIINFFTSIIGVITNLLSFCLETIFNLGTLAEMLVQAVTAIPAVLAIMPPPVTILLSGLVTIAVLYKTLGRE